MFSYDVIEWGQPLERRERETPAPAGTEVLVKLKYCGVCHSDAHIRDGYFDLGGGRRLPMEERGMHSPLTLGHEPFGTVIAAGPAAVGAPIGEDRLIYPWTGCGACAICAEGRDNFCAAARMIGLQRPGGYADHLIVPHPRYLIDARGIDPRWAATLACSGLSAYSAISKLMPIRRDEWVAVIGAGGLGLSAIGFVRALGHEKIVAVDIAPEKLLAATEAGASATLDVRASDARSALKQITAGALCGAVDFVGSADSAELALGAFRKGGKLVLIGLFGGELQLSIAGTILRAITVQGSHLGSVGELEQVVELARAGKIKSIPIQTCPLGEVSRTLDELKQGKILGRVVAEI
jgi:D-arabinose 1-dehydrogenase-like Zn-dependent alcohol dehydrogenase